MSDRREKRIQLARTIFPDGFIDSSREYTTERVIAHLWEQVDSYDFFDALETWVNSNDNYEPEDIARFTAEHLLGPNPNEQEAER